MGGQSKYNFIEFASGHLENRDAAGPRSAEANDLITTFVVGKVSCMEQKCCFNVFVHMRANRRRVHGPVVSGESRSHPGRNTYMDEEHGGCRSSPIPLDFISWVLDGPRPSASAYVWRLMRQVAAGRKGLTTEGCKRATSHEDRRCATKPAVPVGSRLLCALLLVGVGFR